LLFKAYNGYYSSKRANQWARTAPQCYLVARASDKCAQASLYKRHSYVIITYKKLISKHNEIRFSIAVNHVERAQDGTFFTSSSVFLASVLILLLQQQQRRFRSKSSEMLRSAVGQTVPDTSKNLRLFFSVLNKGITSL
jgi:hypothetical protein